MDLTCLTAISPLDGRYTDKLSDLRKLTSEYGLIYFRVLVEVRWLIALANSDEIRELPALTTAQLQYLEDITRNFSVKDAERVKLIEKTTCHDVKAVEYFIRDKIASHTELSHLIPFIHFACTSEDINNLAYALMLKETRHEILLPKIKSLINHITKMAKQYKHLAILSRTHGQSATPSTLGKEFANVAARLARQFTQLQQQDLLGKFNGAVGNYNAHHISYPEINWPKFCEQFVCALELQFNPFTTQIEPHDFIAEFLQTMTRTNNILIDLCRDIWSYISLGYFNQKTEAGEVGSSTMPHKVNPIDFENAEGNLGVANALNEHLALKLPISRWQRDLSDSTVLRNLGSTLGYSVLAYQAVLKGLKKIQANHKIIEQDLDARHEILAEAIQTVLRRHGVEDAYEQLKALTRGKAMTRELLDQFIQESSLPEQLKKTLLALTPANYTGYAVQLIDNFC